MNSAMGYTEGAEVPEDKTKDNELIAQFMERTRRYESTYQIFVANLKYHSDWSWLMPVVEKIEEVLLQVSIHTAYVNICGELNGVKYNQDTCFESQNDTKLTVTYRAVLRAIHFINSVPPTQF